MAVQLTPRTTGGCPNGAVPNPGTAGEVIAIQVIAAAADAVEFFSGFWPGMVATTVLAMEPVSTICNLNPVDPGPLTTDMLIADLAGALIPSSSSPSGTAGWWLWNKCLYAVFSRYCQCSGTGTAPPPPAANVWPPAPVYPTGPDTTPQLTRIENNQTVSTNALQQLYNGLQLIGTDARDLRFRSVENLVQRIGATQFSLSGEGQQALLPFTQASGSTTQDTLGILLELTSIPATVARRGVINQRLYGVGSIEWDCRDPSSVFPHIIAQRDAIHYDYQFILAPQHVQTYTVRWRLQSGVQALGYQVPRNVDAAIYAPMAPYPDAYQAFHTWNPPAGWTDPPIYPAAAARALPTGGGAPP